MVALLVLGLFVAAAEFIRLYFLQMKKNKAEKALIKKTNEIYYLLLLTGDAARNKKTIEESFTEYSNAVVEVVDWKFHSIWRLDEDKQVLYLRFTGHLPDWYIKAFSIGQTGIKVGDACIGETVATKQPLTINDAANDPRFKNINKLPLQTGYQSLTGNPIMGRLRTYGGINTYSDKINAFNLHDEQFLMIVGNLLGMVLENRLLEKYLTSMVKRV